MLLFVEVVRIFNHYHLSFTNCSGFSGLRENIFPSPVIYRPKCGVCGRHTILNGDLSAMINFGARSIRHSSLLDSTFTERVSVSSNGTVLVEAGMPKQEPEMVSRCILYQTLPVFSLPP